MMAISRNFSTDVTRSTILITAAVVAEVAPLIRRLAMRRAEAAHIEFVADIDGARVRLVVTGVGPQRASAVVDPLLHDAPPRYVVITGFAGGLRPDLRVGDVVTAARLIDSDTGASYQPAAGATDDTPVTLLTHDRIVLTPADKAALRARFDADAVDMESALIAARCDAAGVPWVCVRAISDEADHALPEGVERLTRPDGRADLPAALRHAVTRPGDIGRLIRLGRAARRAAAQIASKVPHLLTR